ncbi:MAG: nicotinate (nicotinamide) nucleotide adenylyltransferase [Paludibacteraceae bacterium]|nr:nicotinate (nicotinamide) nucleotide adenylyltransferase [Paludibacteraceae bacterium]
MKVGIYGGSFNPVHFGHVGLAKWVIEHTDLDEVWLLVSPNNPLKNADELAPEQERLAGVRAAIKGIKGLVASDFEFTLPRPSYTANTLRQLQLAYPQHEFVLIIGEDNWNIFTKWREYDYILSTFPIFIYPRHPQPTTCLPGSLPTVDRRSTDSRTTRQADITLPHGAHITYLADAPHFDISSTELRQQFLSPTETK